MQSQHGQTQRKPFNTTTEAKSRWLANRKFRIGSLTGGLVLCAAGILAANEAHLFVPTYQEFKDPNGRFATLNATGPTDTTTNPFFLDIGANGRRCVTCHQPSDAWTVIPAHIQERFDATDGADPIFRTNDGSGCPNQDVSTVEARRNAYSLLLNKGLIRIEQQIPGNAEFTVLDNNNPYGCASTTAISAYRRPLPTANIPYLSTVMWDGRETLKNPDGTFQPINSDLAKQASDATTGHAQGPVPTPGQIQQIISFETQIFTAQVQDKAAGDLYDDGATGGPYALSEQRFFLGINDPLGQNPTGASFTPVVFNLYDSWAGIPDRRHNEYTEARRSIARGQHLFNTLPIPITGVAGLNDALNQPVINGFCGTCHDSPNVGNHSVPAPLNIGLADASRRTPDLPLITVICNATGQLLQATDLGRAMVTGKCAVLPQRLRRDAYGCRRLYDTRFHLSLSQQDKNDLVAFLKTL